MRYIIRGRIPEPHLVRYSIRTWARKTKQSRKEFRMKLTRNSINNTQEWLDAGFKLPQFDIDKVTQNTKTSPKWIHFGAGNIFRAFQAHVVQTLLNQGILDVGLIMCEGYDYEIIEKVDRIHDNLNLLATLTSDGTIEKTVIASIVESLILKRGDQDFDRLLERFANPSLQMVSFTITEKGYSLIDAHGRYTSDIETDLIQGPAHTNSYMGKVVSLLYHRFLNGRYPIAMVSMDNCSHNGDKLRDAVITFAREWQRRDLVDEGFVAYVSDASQVSFPWTMIDKITPRPDRSVLLALQSDGVEGIEPIVTSKNTYIAPFVNAEECEYLVIEDLFPNGRPALEQGGVIYTDRETVDKVEKMKVCTCLNPLHTTLAIFGCLLGYELISEEMKDPDLKTLVEHIGYIEGLPVVVNPGIINPREFIDTVLRVRIPNPFMPDTPHRIATDTSQKLGIRFGETIKAYQDSATLCVTDLKMIPLVFAGWLRYLMGTDDQSKTMELSPDPLLDRMTQILSQVPLGPFGDEQTPTLDALDGILQPILRDSSIFGVDLYEVDMAELVIQYYMEMIQGIGAVRTTLQKYTKEISVNTSY